MHWYLVVLLLILASCGTEQEPTLFTEVNPSASGVQFENRLSESDDFNIIEYLYFYNGGGVAAGDINNDGLCDLYFSANQESNRLYLNKGGFSFEDITLASGTAGPGGWKTGVSMADVNGDGLLDIFNCGVGSYKKFDGRNQLLINNGDLTFRDATEEYGLAFKGFSTQAAFFDYDNDGDLDLYLVNHSVHSVRSHGDASYRHMSDLLAGDRLYRNDHAQTGKPYFTEVTTLVGIYNSQVGYGLAVAISDLNRDGFQDIYVSNDFHENDYLYMNQGDGTFRQELELSMAHTSRFSMGSAAADINNDGWTDIVTVDMLPEDESVIMSTAGEDPYDIYDFKLRFGYHPQYSRNALQVNQGVEPNGRVRFIDVAAFAGIEATDWSWAPLVADFDNDGFKDVFITNGIIGRPNDLDYMNYISKDSAQRFYSDEQLSSQMPEGKVPNVVYRNNQGLRFEKMTWFEDAAGFSNGAAYADLDNDGDLDVAVNNLNAAATIWKNGSEGNQSYSLRVKLKSKGLNSFALGARAEAYLNGSVQYAQLSPVTGWESSVEPVLYFGLGGARRLDSLVVYWPNKAREVRINVMKGTLTLNEPGSPGKSRRLNDDSQPLMNQAGGQSLFTHKENSFSPFESERLLPQGLSRLGPRVAVGDVNNDGLDDFFVGGGAGQAAKVCIQLVAQRFSNSRQPAFAADAGHEDLACDFLDANGDGHLDLVVASGGEEFSGDNELLRVRMYMNGGNGEFVADKKALPQIFVNASAIACADVDGDGDTDMFVGGQVEAGRYGISPRSYLLINDGVGRFSDQTSQWLSRSEIGMVSDALWTDLNSDGKPELVIAGLWTPISVYVNDGKKLVDATHDFKLGHTAGLWNSLAVADFDNDGDSDLVAGNLGLNSRLRADSLRPIELFVADIDGNASMEQILTHYNKDVRYPFASRDQLIKQVPPLKKKFLKYADYARAELESIIPTEVQTVHLRAEMLASVYLENVDGREFRVHLLPSEAQFSSIHAILADDVNKDGFIDLLMGGNSYEMQPEIGRLDASCGVFLTGDGKGGFVSQPLQAGFYVEGQVRDIAKVRMPGGAGYFVSRNNDTMEIFYKKNK